MLEVIGRGPDAVVDRDNDREKPREDRQDLISDDSPRAVGVLLGEGVD